MLTDLSEAELGSYRSSVAMPADFDEFWATSISLARSLARPVEIERVLDGPTVLDVWDLTFSGWNGEPIRGWYLRPAGIEEDLPTVVQYIGYGGGRGNILENLIWASSGFAHVVMDSRGQGSTHRQGATPDHDETGPSYPGFMTRGIASRETYYYRRLIVDAVRAVDTALELPGVRRDRVFTVGGSQGGALSLAAGALHPIVDSVVAFVPFLSDIRHATLITDEPPYREIALYLATQRSEVDRAFATLEYFDSVNFARRAHAPALFSTSLMDPICPPSTVFGAYNEYSAPKTMKVWQYNGHIGGGVEDETLAVRFLRDRADRSG